MINYAQELNPEQLKAVLNGNGHCLVLAGAGSGKTRTITYRVAYLLEQGVKPENILLVTFTNKAAAEMKARVKNLMSDQNGRGERPLAPTSNGELPWSGTFHHIGYRILKQYAPLLGYKNNFTVLDSDDSESLIKICIKAVKNDETGTKFPSASVIHNIISYARNAQLPLTKVIEDRLEQWIMWDSEINEIAKRYEQKKKEANAMDFDDLLTNLLKLLSGETTPNPSLKGGVAKNPPLSRGGQGGVSHNPILQKLATQFKYILVDEYQDTNKIQAAIIKQLASVNNNVLVVGDDAQSIYSFRAADISNILNFTREYNNAKIFKLEINYRSTKPILDVANSVILNNVEQYKKNLHPIGGVGAKGLSPLPMLAPQIDQQSEATFIAKKIEELIKNKTPEKEIAVLFRAAYHSQALEVELVSRGIAYDYRGGVRFFERAHVKDVLSYLRILNNLADTAAWLRVLMREEGIGPAAAEKIINEIRKVGAQNLEPSPNNSQDGRVQNIEPLHKVADIGKKVLGNKALVGWNNFLIIWEAMVGSVGAQNVGAQNIEPSPNNSPAGRVQNIEPLQPANLINIILQTPYRNYLEAEFIDSKDRLLDLKQLAIFAGRYTELDKFLAETTLQESFRAIESDPSSQPSPVGGRSVVSSPHGRGQGEGHNKIVLSTIHQAKGLEWQVVFIINLSSGAFPNERAAREEGGIEEERRLFYVAITRAKKHLFLTYPMAGGNFGDTLSGPSMFLDEIETGLLDDRSLLLNNSSVFNNSSELEYVDDEDKPIKIKPGSFLRDLDDL